MAISVNFDDLLMALTTIPKEQWHSTARLRVTSTLKRDATTSAKCSVAASEEMAVLNGACPVLITATYDSS